ncbi:MAG: zf-HC2 domain-containing protein [Nocardiopsaceae bacterium]|nr:zf-HC2 domain-containing protein [Nocardiopsaceae bacterium]
MGDTLSALVDGELTGADLDRANAHLASCERCQCDAAALRSLKTQLRGLAANTGHDDLTLRLLAMESQPALPEGEKTASLRRYLMWSALSLAVVGGVGAAAFSLGGGPSAPAPNVVPPVQMFSVQHASVTGDVPFPEPTRAPQRQP